ncbi:MAG: hypothetical protein ACXABK_04460 [Candidatus Heimdallarchaeaceae archaeon]
MSEAKEKAKRWIEKLKITTKLFLDLPDDMKLPNGWSKRELGIHLRGWDDELIKIAEHLKKGKAFIWEEFCPEEADVYNARFLEQSKGISKEEVLSGFEKTRSVIIKVYEDLLDNYFDEEKKHLAYFSLWWHDVHHLKDAGVNVEDLME